MQIMGIVNMTPDSFSDGGQYNTVNRCLEQVEEMVREGADIIDVGGESSRPFADPVAEADELERVIPVISQIRRCHAELPISIDTTKAQVAARALEAGATMINDISALEHDPEMVTVARQTNVPIIIMHRQGTPGTMQVKPHYDDVVGEISDFFRWRIDRLEVQGIDRQRLTIDPGIGFGKTLEHNLSILKHLEAFQALGQPVLLGHSRKRFIGDITGLEVDERDLVTAVVSAMGVMKQVAILRVHDVRSTRQAVQMAEAINTAS